MISSPAIILSASYPSSCVADLFCSSPSSPFNFPSSLSVHSRSSFLERLQSTMPLPPPFYHKFPISICRPSTLQTRLCSASFGTTQAPRIHSGRSPHKQRQATRLQHGLRHRAARVFAPTTSHTTHQHSSARTSRRVKSGTDGVISLREKTSRRRFWHCTPSQRVKASTTLLPAFCHSQRISFTRSSGGRVYLHTISRSPPLRISPGMHS